MTILLITLKWILIKEVLEILLYSWTIHHPKAIVLYTFQERLVYSIIKPKSAPKIVWDNPPPQKKCVSIMCIRFFLTLVLYTTLLHTGIQRCGELGEPVCAIFPQSLLILGTAVWCKGLSELSCAILEYFNILCNLWSKIIHLRKSGLIIHRHSGRINVN